MQPKLLSALTVLAASTVLASAVPAKRDLIPGEVYVCPETNWGGACEDLIYELALCQRGATLFNGTFGSIGPNQDTVCLGYTNANCSGNPTWGFAYPGDATRGVDVGNPWGSNLTSLVCYSKNLD